MGILKAGSNYVHIHIALREIAKMIGCILEWIVEWLLFLSWIKKDNFLGLSCCLNPLCFQEFVFEWLSTNIGVSFGSAAWHVRQACWHVLRCTSLIRSLTQISICGTDIISFGEFLSQLTQVWMHGNAVSFKLRMRWEQNSAWKNCEWGRKVAET